MRYGFGIDVGGTTVKLAWFDETGRLLDKWEIPTVTAGGGEQILTDMILHMPKQNPLKMAEYIIREIEQDYGCYYQDDLTVLVCGIWNKR